MRHRQTYIDVSAASPGNMGGHSEHRRFGGEPLDVQCDSGLERRFSARCPSGINEYPQAWVATDRLESTPDGQPCPRCCGCGGPVPAALRTVGGPTYARAAFDMLGRGPVTRCSRQPAMIRRAKPTSKSPRSLAKFRTAARRLQPLLRVRQDAANCSGRNQPQSGRAAAQHGMSLSVKIWHDSPGPPSPRSRLAYHGCLITLSPPQVYPSTHQFHRKSLIVPSSCHSLSQKDGIRRHAIRSHAGEPCARRQKKTSGLASLRNGGFGTGL